MECQCNQITELNGRRAQDYVKEHLVKTQVYSEAWEIKYQCPKTGASFIKDFPHSELQGGGHPRLRKVNT